MKGRVWFFATFLILAPRFLAAQTISGSVVDATTGAPVAQANIVVHRTGASPLATIAADDGTYRIRLPEPGTFRIQASRQGYAPAFGDSLFIAADDSVTVSPIALTPQPVVLDEVTATGRLGRLTPGREWIRQRQLLGKGRFFSGAMLARANPRSLTRHLAAELDMWVRYSDRGVPTLRNPRSCMLILVNEWPINRTFVVDGFSETLGIESLDAIPLERIAAVEVYDDMREVPPGWLWFVGGTAHACGVLNVWTWDSY